MIYAAIVYLSWAVFFLTQAHIYARVTRERIIGALTWPLLIFILPHIVHAYVVGKEEMERTLCFDERMGCKSIKIGDRWGIGA